MAATAITPKGSHGTALKISISASQTPIPGVQDIDGPELGFNTKEVYMHDDGGKRVVTGAKNAQQMTFKMVLDTSDTTQEYVIAACEGKTLETFEKTSTEDGASVLTFNGYISSVKTADPIDGESAVSVTVEIDGEVSRA